MPSWRWLREYDAAAGRRDLIAGLLIATLLIPQAAAYAFLAGLPASAGFLAASFAPLGYAVWATSRQVSVGPVALLSLLTATAVSSSPGDPLETAAQLALLVGLLLVLIGFFRIGHLTNFISEPVLTGFIGGAALIIGMTQAGNFLGVELERGGTFVESMQALVQSLPETNLYALALASVTLAALVMAPAAVKSLCRRLDYPDGTTTALSNLSLLGVLAIAVVLTFLFKLPVDTVGAVNVSFPRLEWIALGGLDGIRRLLPDALAIAFIGYLMAYGTAASLAGRRRLTVDRDHEAGALGLANIVSAFAGGYPSGASLSRSAVAGTLNAHSSIASVLAGLMTLGLGLASLGIFAYVAKAVLAALIMKAVVGMIDIGAIVRFIRCSKTDAAGVLVTLTAVLVLGVRWGVAAGAMTSIVTYLLRTSMPRVVVEGLPDDDDRPMRDAERRDRERAPSEVLVLRMDDHLYFGSAAHLEQEATATVAENPHVDHLVLSLKTTGMIDATGIEMLERLNENLKDAGVTLHLAHAHKPVERQLRHSGLIKRLQQDKIFDSAREAVAALAEREK